MTELPIFLLFTSGGFLGFMAGFFYGHERGQQKVLKTEEQTEMKRTLRHVADAVGAMSDAIRARR